MITYDEPGVLYDDPRYLYDGTAAVLEWYLLVNWDGSGWHDISGDALALTWRRGSAGEFGSGGEGGATVELRNPSNKYLDTNPSSPYYGLLRAGGEVFFAGKKGSSLMPIFGGYVKVLDPRASHIPLERQASLACEDVLGMWSRRKRATIPAQLNGIGVRDARDAVLDEVGVPADQRELSETNDPVVYGELVEIRDAAGAITSTFEAGFTDTPTGVLDALNKATLGRHCACPGPDESAPWRYVAVDRNHKIDADPDEQLTHLIDYSDLAGWRTADDTEVDYVVVRPRQPTTGAQVEADAGDSNGVSQVEISSPLIPSESAAQGIADHYQWRFRAERQRPKLIIEDASRVALMLRRDLYDVVAITDDRYHLSGRRMEIVGITGEWRGAQPRVTWQLQDAPQQPPLQKFWVLGRDALDDASVLVGR